MINGKIFSESGRCSVCNVCVCVCVCVCVVVLTADGGVYTFGSNQHGQLGTGDTAALRYTHTQTTHHTLVDTADCTYSRPTCTQPQCTVYVTAICLYAATQCLP